MKKLSIIIPVYNEERTILQVLNKLVTIKLIQSVERELVIVNDNSTDESEKIILNFKKDNPKTDIQYFKHEKNKGKGAKIISDYDHNDDGSIWVGYEINEKTRSGKNFAVENSLYNIIKGKYNVDGMNHKINIANKSITRVGNEIFQDKLKLGDEIIFTFNLNKSSVQIDIGEKIMQKKYN